MVNMTKIIIDTDLCTGCRNCSSFCPYGILILNEDKGVAEVNPQIAAFCSKCGHCGAICPVRAITVEYDGAGKIPDVQNIALPDRKQIARLFTSRRSIRAYKKDRVPREILEELLDIVRYAPTGMNGQSVRWLVIDDPAELHSFIEGIIDWSRDVVKNDPTNILAPILPMIIQTWEQGIDRICHGAPHLIIAYGHKDIPVCYTDSIIALTHLDLAAPVFGLGTCWAGIVQIALMSSPELMKKLALPADMVPQYGMMIGYPDCKYTSIPSRNKIDIIWR